MEEEKLELEICICREISKGFTNIDLGGCGCKIILNQEKEKSDILKKGIN